MCLLMGVVKKILGTVKDGVFSPNNGKKFNYIKETKTKKKD